MGDNTQTSTSTTGSSNPHVTSTLNGLLDQVDSIRSAGPQVYNHSLYSPAGDTTRSGWSSMLNAADNPGYGQGINEATNFSRGLIGSAGQPSLTEQTLMGTAQGNNFGQNDPGYARIRQGVIDDTLGAVGSQFTNSGRFGGSSYINDASHGVGDAVTGLDYSNYQSDVARQQQALQAIEGQRQQRIGNAQAGASALPGLFQAGLLPSSIRGQVGAAQDADAQGQLQGEADLFGRQHNANLGLLNDIMSSFNGLAGAGGQTQTNTQPGTPWWQTALGGGIGLLGLLGG